MKKLYIDAATCRMPISCSYPTLKTEILFSKNSTEGVEAGQVTAAGENYTMPGFEKQEKVIDYDNEKLREENAEEVRRQWED